MKFKIDYLYCIAFIALMVKGLVFSFAFPDAIILGLFLGYFGYKEYLNQKVQTDPNQELRDEVQRLSTMVNSSLMYKNLGTGMTGRK